MNKKTIICIITFITVSMFAIGASAQDCPEGMELITIVKGSKIITKCLKEKVLDNLGNPKIPVVTAECPCDTELLLPPEFCDTAIPQCWQQDTRDDDYVSSTYFYPSPEACSSQPRMPIYNVQAWPDENQPDGQMRRCFFYLKNTDGSYKYVSSVTGISAEEAQACALEIKYFYLDQGFDCPSEIPDFNP